MEILGFIPARGGSKGIPNKNIRNLGRKPLISYTIEEALKSNIHRLFVSTDSSKIADISEQYGIKIPFLRPSRLAQDDSIIEESIADTLNKLKKRQLST